MTLTSSIDKSKYLRGGSSSLEMQQRKFKIEYILHYGSVLQNASTGEDINQLKALSDKSVPQVTAITLFSAMLMSSVVGQQAEESRHLPRDLIGPSPNLG